MYGLPENFDGKILIGNKLEMVCFSKNQIFFHFSAKIFITVTSAFSYKSNKVDEIPNKNVNFVDLLESTITNVDAERDGTLSLQFDNGEMLKIYDTSTQYESYVISLNGKEIIV